MSRRTRTEVFMEVLGKLRERKSLGRGELMLETLTNPGLFEECIDSLERNSMLKRTYSFWKDGRQKEVLEATDNIDNSELQVRALADILSPKLSELFDQWYSKRHQAAEPRLTPEEREKEADKKRTQNLVRRLFKSEESKE